MSQWEDWKKCTKTCGSGIKTRIRTKLVEESNGGKCEDDLSEEEECNTKPCPEPCKWAEWQDWSACSQSCGTGKMVRVRVKELEEKNGGVCKGKYRFETICNTNLCPQPCKWGEWGDWEPCSETCGGGEQIRTREKEIEEKHGGSCLGAFNETGTCNMQSCPQNCQVGEWNDWSDCSKTCETGEKKRTREKKVEESNGGKCLFALIEEDFCQTQACPEKTTMKPTPSPECQWHEWGDWKECDEPCELSKWGAWTKCSKTCGKGKRIRSQFIQGPNCIDFAEQVEECNFQSCEGKRILSVDTLTKVVTNYCITDSFI